MQPKLKFLLAILVSTGFLSLSGLVSAQPPGGMGAGPDFSSAAESLGVTEDELIDALGGPPPNFAEAAEKLGITEEQLMEVIPAPPEGGRPQ